MSALEIWNSVLLFVSGESLLSRLFLGSLELAVLAGLVWVLMTVKLVRAPRWQAALWLVVMTKAVVVIVAGSTIPIVELTAPAGGPAVSVPTAIGGRPAHPPAQAATSSGVERPDNAPAPDSPPARPASHWTYARMLLAAWLAGVILFACRALVDRLRLHRLVAGALPAAPPLQARYQQIAASMAVKGAPRLCVTDALESPALAGVVWPAVLVPAWMMEEKWSQKLDWALRHELMHWRMRDPWANAVRQVAQTLFFFHPVVWWVGGQWQESAELACDRALVTSDIEAEEYAGALYQVLAEIHTQRRRPYASGLFATRTQIGRRIAALLGNCLAQRARLGLAGGTLAAVIALATLTLGVSFATAGNGAHPLLKTVGEAIEKLSKTAETQQADVKEVLDAVALMPPAESLPQLTAILEDQSPTRRRSAVYILGALSWTDPGQCFPALEKLLAHKENYTRGMAALTLATLGDQGAYDAVATMAKDDKDNYARRCAAFALGEFGDPKALGVLQALVNDPVQEVQQNAQNAVDRLTFLQQHANAADDAKPAVRAIWMVAGSAAHQDYRINQAMALFAQASPAAQETVLKETVSSNCEPIRNSAMLIRRKLGEKKKAHIMTPPPSPGNEADESALLQGLTRVGYVDDTKEAQWSLGGSGHGEVFDRPADMRYVEAIQIYAGRYGEEQPPKEDFKVYLLNEQRQVLAVIPYPYTTVARGDMKWYTLPTPAVEAPGQFYVAIDFNPNEYKGIYLGCDTNVEQSHSFSGLVNEGFEPVDKKYDWMIRVWMAKEPGQGRETLNLSDWQAPMEAPAPFAQCIEGKYDTGESECMQSYGGSGPRITYNLADFFPNGAPGNLVLKGFRLYASRYGAGYDPDTTRINLTVQDKAGNPLGEEQFSYARFGAKVKWVDLPLTSPLPMDKLAKDTGLFSVSVDPGADKYKGVYFYYNKNPQKSHSSVGTVGAGFEDVADREWIIRAMFAVGENK